MKCINVRQRRHHHIQMNHFFFFRKDTLLTHRIMHGKNINYKVPIKGTISVIFLKQNHSTIICNFERITTTYYDVLRNTYHIDTASS